MHREQLQGIHTQLLDVVQLLYQPGVCACITPCLQQLADQGANELPLEPPVGPSQLGWQGTADSKENRTGRIESHPPPFTTSVSTNSVFSGHCVTPRAMKQQRKFRYRDFLLAIDSQTVQR